MYDNNGTALEWRMKQIENTRPGERLAVLETDMESHAATVKRIESKLDSTNNWLRGIAGSLILALILLVANLVFGTHLPPPGH